MADRRSAHRSRSEYTRIEAIDVFDDGTNTRRGSLLFRELTAALLN